MKRKKMKRYKMVVKFNYYTEVELEAANKADFKDKVNAMDNDEICGADIIPVIDLDIDLYGPVEEVQE